jgi:hypothetical protein
MRGPLHQQRDDGRPVQRRALLPPISQVAVAVAEGVPGLMELKTCRPYVKSSKKFCRFGKLYHRNRLFVNDVLLSVSKPLV